MINLAYSYVQDSCSLELAGMPDVSNGDSDETIGICSSWRLKIIGSPLLEGEKEHLDNLMQVILSYSRSYISGVRESFISEKKIVTISPSGISHKLLLNSTREEVEPLEIILDDSELSDLTRCIDHLRLDPRINIRWNLNDEIPFTRKQILSSISKNKINSNFFLSLVIFLSTSFVLLLLPTNNKFEYVDTTNINPKLSDQLK